MPRLNEALIANERYRGEPSTDDEGRTQWPIRIIWDDELPGFGVRIHPPVRGKPSRKDFIVTWKIGLKSRTMGIGTFGVDCTLRQARKVAREALDLARRGQDPIEARHRALGIGTAEDLASRFLFEHTAAKRKGPIPGDAGSAVTVPDPAPEESVDPGASPAAATPAADASVGDAVAAADPAASGTVDTGVVASGAPSTPSEPTATTVNVSRPRAAPSERAPTAGPASEQADAAEPSDAQDDDAVSAVEPPGAAESRGKETSDAPAAPPPVSAPRIGETRRAAAPVPKRGPTKVRLLPVPESLYRTIETGARESEMTISAYLNALIEIARAALGEDGAEAGGGEGGGDAAPESAPAIKELFSRVQEAQAVEVGGSSADDRDPEHGPRRG